MGFFGGYENSGPGVSKNPENKTAVARFFGIYVRRFWKLMTLNLMYFIFFIPPLIMLNIVFSETLSKGVKTVGACALGLLFLLTVGPATAGFTKVIRNYSQERNAFIWSDFVKAFKQNYVQALIMGIIDSIFAVGFAVAIISYNEWAQQNTAIYIPFVIALSCMLMFIMMHFYIYLLIVSTNLSLKNILKNSFLLVGVSLKKCIFMLFITFVIAGLIAFLYPYSFFVIPFLPLSFLCLLICFNCYPVIREYVIDPYYDERGEENPEDAYKSDIEDEAVFEDKGGEELPIEVKKTRKKKIK